MDAEHLQIHRAVAELQAALAAGAESGELESSLRRLAQEVAGHFRHEERLMRLAQYPAYEWHKRQHATARRKLQELAAELNTSEEAVAEEIARLEHDEVILGYLAEDLDGPAEKK